MSKCPECAVARFVSRISLFLRISSFVIRVLELQSVPTTAALRWHRSDDMLGSKAMSRLVMSFICLLAVARTIHGQTALDLRVPVEVQPLSANITRVLQALHFLGAPLPSET